MGLDETELIRPPRQEDVQKGREALIYLARRHGEVNPKELVDFLKIERDVDSESWDEKGGNSC